MIYVDDLRPTERTAKWRHTKACHMFTDKRHLAELHEMAERIGLRREWLDDRGALPHYDLVPSKRVEAVEMGAVEVQGWAMLKACMRTFREGMA